MIEFLLLLIVLAILFPNLVRFILILAFVVIVAFFAIAMQA
ncbi:MAG: hypothetical protein VW313_10050 [Gammaproteobacteria bacterium]